MRGSNILEQITLIFVIMINSTFQIGIIFVVLNILLDLLVARYKYFDNGTSGGGWSPIRSGTEPDDPFASFSSTNIIIVKTIHSPYHCLVKENIIIDITNNNYSKESGLLSLF